MQRFHRLLAATMAALLLHIPVWGQQAHEKADDQRMESVLVAGTGKMRAGKTAEAIAEHFDPVIQEYEGKFRNGKTRVYSSRSPMESLLYMLEAANSEPKQNAAAYSYNWGLAYYLKGYALVELKRLPEAAAALDSALALAPKNSQFLSERGQLYLTEKNWSEARKTLAAAEAAAREFSPEEVKTGELSRALRGQAYALIELGKLDEAEKLYAQCLQLNKDDRAAKNQLRYIANLREKQDAAAAAQTDPARKNFDTAWQIADAQFIAPSVQSYVRNFATGGIWNDQGVQRRAAMPDEKAILECVTAIAPSPTKARMVFIVDEKGVVTAAHTDQTGWIADCMKEKLVGHRIPMPPRAPLYYCSRYEKTGEDTTETSNCGPVTLVSSCEQKGTTKRCTFQMR